MSEDTELIQLTEIRTVHPANDVSKAQMIADQKKIKEQAKISFKAGYEKAIRESSAISHLDVYNDGRRAGIKKVVEWLKLNLPDEYASIMEWSVWQAQLKEWNV